MTGLRELELLKNDLLRAPEYLSAYTPVTVREAIKDIARILQDEYRVDELQTVECAGEDDLRVYQGWVPGANGSVKPLWLYRKVLYNDVELRNPFQGSRPIYPDQVTAMRAHVRSELRLFLERVAPLNRMIESDLKARKDAAACPTDGNSTSG